jgi:Ca2+-binding EF-hand superfamily protein
VIDAQTLADALKRHTATSDDHVAANVAHMMETLDTSGTGEISRSEFVKRGSAVFEAVGAGASGGASAPAPPKVQQLSATSRPPRSRSSWLVAAKSTHLSPPQLAGLRDAFNAADVGSTGTVDPEEFGRLVVSSACSRVVSHLFVRYICSIAASVRSLRQCMFATSVCSLHLYVRNICLLATSVCSRHLFARYICLLTTQVCLLHLFTRNIYLFATSVCSLH